MNIFAFDNLEQKLVWTLFAIMIALVGGYIYLVNVSVFNIMARKNAEEQINNKATVVAQLESEYIGLTSKIDMDMAYALGFKDASSEGSYAKTAANSLSYRLR